MNSTVAVQWFHYRVMNFVLHLPTKSRRMLKYRRFVRSSFNKASLTAPIMLNRMKREVWMRSFKTRKPSRNWPWASI